MTSEMLVTMSHRKCVVLVRKKGLQPKKEIEAEKGEY